MRRKYCFAIAFFVAINFLLVGCGTIVTSGDKVEPGSLVHDVKETETVYYFIEQMQIGVINKVGQPIEGFEPFMFMQSFSGLKEDDFDNADALLGTYRLVNHRLIFEERKEEAMHSAAKAVSIEGMRTVLKNVENRLDIRAINKESVDNILSILGEG